jgi:hypothetical protein
MRLTRGIFLEMAILKDECANPRIDYIPQEKLCQLVFGGSGLTGTHLVSVVHGQGDTGSLEIVHVHDDLVSAISRGVGQFQLSRPGGDKVGRFVLFRKRKKGLQIKGISPRCETTGGKGSSAAVPDRRTRDVR